MKKDKKSFFKKILAKKKLLIGLAVILIGGFLIWKFVISPKSGSGETTTVAKGTVTEELILSGEIAADEYANLIFSSSGRISWVGVKEGDEVKKGQALSKLDTTYLNASYQKALSDLRAAEASLDSVYDQLQGHAKDETYAQRDTRTTYEVAKDKAYEAYIQALDNLKNATLIAPFAGIVSFVAHPFPGSNVIYTESQVELINPETIYFDVTADQSEVLELYVGQEVRITLDSMSDEVLKGKVTFISYAPKKGEIGASYKVKVKFYDEKIDYKKYRIAMSGEASFVLSEKQDVLYLPPKFVKSDTGGKYVRKSGKNGKTYITVGAQGEERIEVSGDIKEGELIYD